MTKEEILTKYPDIEINESGGPDNFNPDAPIVERDPIAVIIQHPNEDLFLIAKWKNVDWKGLLTGGIEEGDTLEETVYKEIHEEAGYKNIAKIVKLDCMAHGLFFHTIKNVNRLAHYHGVFAQLENLEHDEVSEEEQSIADFVWVPKDEVLDILTGSDMKKLWQYFLNRK